MQKIHEYLGMIVRNAQILEQHLAFIVANDAFVKRSSLLTKGDDFEDLVKENDVYLKELLSMPLGDLMEQADRNRSVSLEILATVDRNRIERNYAVHRLFKLSDDLSWTTDGGGSKTKDEVEARLKKLVDETYDLERRLITVRNELAHKYNGIFGKHVNGRK